MEKSREQLEQENDELRIRLQEAEETLEAIRSGAVDAIVVSQGQQEQVFTLQGAESAYRTILEELSEGAATLAADGTIVYCNGRFAEILGRPLDQVLGTRIEQYVLPADGATLVAMLHHATPDASRGEVRFGGNDSTAVPVYVSLAAHAGSPAASVCMVATDLRERKRSEEILASEARMRAMADAIPQLAWIARSDGFIHWYNRRWYEYTGTTLPQMQGWGWQSVHDPEALSKVLERWKAAIATGVPFEMVFPLRGADGTFRQFLTRAQPLKDRDGRVVQWFGTNTDVDELKRTEAALRESEERLRLAQASAHAGVWDWNPRTGVTVFTAENERLYGLAPDTVHTYEDFRRRVHPDDIARIEAERDAAIARRQPFDLEFRIVQESGECRWLSAKGGAVYDEVGEVIRVFGVNLDITERKRMEQALRDSERLYRAIGESIDYGVWVCDPVGRNTYASESFLKMVGMTQEQCSEFGWGDVLHPDDSEATIAAWKECVRSGGMWYREHRFKGVDGQWHPVLACGVPVRNESGEITSWAGINLDISRIKQAEEQLKEWSRTLEQRVAERTAVAEHRTTQLRALAAQLTQAEQKERQRLAMVLHDHLQQLLVGMKFSISILRSHVQGDDGPRFLSQLGDLVDQSIDTSRSLTIELCPPILTTGTMSEVLNWLAGWFASKHGLRVEVQTDEQAHPPAEEIRVLLFQATRELLFNIVKHAGVDRARVEMARLEDGRACVSVTDAGAGFDPAQIEPGSNGTGSFGLFSLRERMEAIGGQLRIDSSPGKGTRGTLIAPMQLTGIDARRADTGVGEAMSMATAIGSTPESGRHDDGQAIRVLLADDHQVMRDGLARLLQIQPGIKVVGLAADGLQAVEMALRLRPNIVIMDVNMPHLAGVEATRRIRARLPGTQIIGLSMFSENSVQEAMLGAGATAYLAKTSAPEALAAKIRECAAKLVERQLPFH